MPTSVGPSPAPRSLPVCWGGGEKRGGSQGVHLQRRKPGAHGGWHQIQSQRRRGGLGGRRPGRRRRRQLADSTRGAARSSAPETGFWLAPAGPPTSCPRRPPRRRQSAPAGEQQACIRKGAGGRQEAERAAAAAAAVRLVGHGLALCKLFRQHSTHSNGAGKAAQLLEDGGEVRGQPLGSPLRLPALPGHGCCGKSAGVQRQPVSSSLSTG